MYQPKSQAELDHSLQNDRTYIDGVRTAHLGVAGAWPPRAAARARDRKLVQRVLITFLKIPFLKLNTTAVYLTEGTYSCRYVQLCTHIQLFVHTAVYPAVLNLV
jgi:hypothetical protein